MLTWRSSEPSVAFFPLTMGFSAASERLVTIAKIGKKICNLKKFKYFCTKIIRKR